MLFSASAAEAAFSEPPQVDFRDPIFAAADGQHSFMSTFTTEGTVIEFTLKAFVVGSGSGDGAALLWWDPVDGIGIRGGNQNDEIDENETLLIQFSQTIGLSHVFFSDFFAGEHVDTTIFNESGLLQLDTQTSPIFLDAGALLSTDGNKANGEAVLELDKIIPVNEILLRGFGAFDRSEFSVIGFTDPVLDAPEPMSLALLGTGMIGIGLFRQRRRRRAG